MKEEESNTLYERFNIDVDSGQIPLRIDKFLLDRLPKISRNKVQIAIKEGLVLVNGLAVKTNYKVRPADHIAGVSFTEEKEYKIIPEKVDFEIVFEDDHILVINKPPGIVVHPGHGNYSGTLIHGIAHYLNIQPDSTDPRPGLVHRIDKDTSGLLVVAKTDTAKARLAKQFFDHTVERKYQAIVWGEFDEEQGTIEGNIDRDTKNRMRFRVYPDGDKGKWAKTHYKVLESLGYVSLLEFQLETGRTHQIRVHARYIGHQIFNDSLYGGDRILRGTVFTKYKQFVNNCFKLLPRQALHAKTLGFIHPETKEAMHFSSELPENFEASLVKWRGYTDKRALDE